MVERAKLPLWLLCLAFFLFTCGVAAAPLPANELVLHRFALEAPPSPFGWVNFAALDLGDVNGDGLVEVVVSSPAGAGSDAPDAPLVKAALPTPAQEQPFRLEVFQLVAAFAGQAVTLQLAPLGEAGRFPFTVNGLTVADLYPTGPAEIWPAWLPKVGALEFDGAAFQAKEGWQTWANKPVVAGRYGPRVTSNYLPQLAAGGSRPGVEAPPRGQEKLLALAYYYSPEVAVGLVTVSRPVKCPTKEKDVAASAFFSPQDRFAAADINGDGRDELLTAWSRFSAQFPPRPFTITDLWSGAEKGTLPIQPDEVAVGDVDGDGRPEVILAENQLAADGWPRQALVKVLRWSGGALREVKQFAWPDAWVSDLAVGDADNNGQDDLALTLAVHVKGTRDVELRVVFPYQGLG
ncbi:MAG: FG-GAP repeat domain-containing protein [Chitinophagales bacterium]